MLFRSPEESIYQIGTMGESVPPDTLFSIVNEFYEEFERRFGSHIHILDWALHLDEGTPHIHERHVFDCENRYGELCPQQEKAPVSYTHLDVYKRQRLHSAKDNPYCRGRLPRRTGEIQVYEAEQQPY